MIQAAYAPFKAWVSCLLLKRQRKRLETLSKEHPKRPVALIIAAKGVSPTFDHFLELVLHQDYPAYRLIFVTESTSDPAQAAIRQHLGLASVDVSWTRPDAVDTGVSEVQLVVAGLAHNQGQKVHNQLAAFQHLRAEDEIIAFADADIVGGEQWLWKLVTPINVGETELTTGYRWFIPRTNRFSTLVATNINAGIGILAGPSWHTLLWGGSMAMSRGAFENVGVPRVLAGSLNDDLQISREARRAGYKLYFVRSLMAPSPVDYTWESFFEFGRRQYYQVLTYVPRYWAIGLFFTSAWLIGFSVTWGRFLLLGDVRALWWILAVAFLIVLKGFLRTSYLREQFDRETIAHLWPARVLELFTTTLNMAIHLLVILSAAPLRGITWAGIKYRVNGRQETEVVSRS